MFTASQVDVNSNNTTAGSRALGSGRSGVITFYIKKTNTIAYHHSIMSLMEGVCKNVMIFTSFVWTLLFEINSKLSLLNWNKKSSKVTIKLSTLYLLASNVKSLKYYWHSDSISITRLMDWPVLVFYKIINCWIFDICLD